jgi:hypothetical protein
MRRRRRRGAAFRSTPKRLSCNCRDCVFVYVLRFGGLQYLKGQKRENHLEKMEKGTKEKVNQVPWNARYIRRQNIKASKTRRVFVPLSSVVNGFFCETPSCAVPYCSFPLLASLGQWPSKATIFQNFAFPVSLFCFPSGLWRWRRVAHRSLWNACVLGVSVCLFMSGHMHRDLRTQRLFFLFVCMFQSLLPLFIRFF